MTADTPTYSRPHCAVITVPDPDSMPVSHHAEQGGTIQWRTDAHNYPNFEICFQGVNPFDETLDVVLAGSVEKPVVIRLNTIGEEYRYTVSHYNKRGTCIITGPFEFNVNPCRGCQVIK